MAGPKKPMMLNLATGGKHWTKEQIAERLRTEVHPVAEGIEAPTFLTAKQKKEFDKIAAQLERLGVMGETDCTTLAQYVVAQELYVQAVKDIRAMQKQKPKDMAPADISAWAGALTALDKRCDRYFKQALTAASALGLTISSRCKLVVPIKEEEPKQNKFKKFGSA